MKSLTANGVTFHFRMDTNSALGLGFTRMLNPRTTPVFANNRSLSHTVANCHRPFLVLTGWEKPELMDAVARCVWARARFGIVVALDGNDLKSSAHDVYVTLRFGQRRGVLQTCNVPRFALIRAGGLTTSVLAESRIKLGWTNGLILSGDAAELIRGFALAQEVLPELPVAIQLTSSRYIPVSLRNRVSGVLIKRK